MNELCEQTIAAIREMPREAFRERVFRGIAKTQRFSELVTFGAESLPEADREQIQPPSEDDANPFVVLPEQNFNAFFGTTAFSQKWIYALTGPILERKTCDGVCKYRINKALLGEGGPDRE